MKQIMLFLVLCAPTVSSATAHSLFLAIASFDVHRVEFEVSDESLSLRAKQKGLKLVNYLIKQEERKDIWYKKPGALACLVMGALVSFYSGKIFFLSPWRHEASLASNIQALLSGRVRPYNIPHSLDYEASNVNTFTLGASGGFLVGGLTLLMAGMNGLSRVSRSLVHALAMKAVIERELVKKIKDVGDNEKRSDYSADNDSNE